MITLENLARIAELEFSDIVEITLRMQNKLRILLTDASYIDVYLSQKIENKFGFHWETKDKDLHIYRYDNFPNTKWRELSTFPYHFHNGSQENVILPPFKGDVVQEFTEFMEFVRDKIKIS